MDRRILVVGLLVAAVLVTIAGAGEPGITSGTFGNSAVQEVVSQRNGNTRVWEVTRQVPVTDDATGLTEMVTVKNQVYEKADNLCYNRSETTTPDWVPTVEEITPSNVSGVAYEAKQGAYQVSFVGDLTAPWSIIYKVKDQTFRLGIKYLGYYDSSNGSSVFLATPNAVTPQLAAPNKLIYRNVFPGVDIEYVYTKGAFLQNAIVNSVSSYQTPSHYGFNPKSTQLIVATEMDLMAKPNLQVSVNKQMYVGDTLSANDNPIDISNSNTEKLLCRFEPNQAFDNAESRKEISVQQRVVSINNHNYLIEGIPYPWLQTASLPVTIDYELWSNTYMGGHELWRSGQTIYVSGLVHVISGSSLVIEGGAVVKFGSNAHLRADAGGQIQVMGNKFDYVIFTSANDESVGEDVTVGTTTAYQTDYNAALEYNSGAQNNSRVNYAKIRYATYGIKYQSSGLSVKDSIFRDCYIAIYCGNTSGAAITNNIISGCLNGIIADSSAQVQVNQNTIDSTGMALYAIYNGTIQYYDNIISNCGYAAYSTAGGSFPIEHHNAFWDNTTSPPSINSTSSILLGSPYLSSPNGQYYLNPGPIEWPNFCIFPGGSTTAQAAGMQFKTTVTPSISTTTLNTYTNAWGKVPCDTGTVDIGYHYDPVDMIIQPWTEGSCYLNVSDPDAPLSIDSGVVVSFYRTLSNNTICLRVKSSSKMSAVGTDSDFIQFTSIYATSDDIQAPLRGGLDLYDYYGITLRYDANPDSNIQYSDIKYAQYGIRVNEDMNITRPIQNNVFQQNYQGLAFNYSGHAVNNLFTDNKYGILLGSYGTPTVLVSYLQSNTFYNNNTAVCITNTLSSTTARKIITRLENNIFTSNYAGTISTTSTNSSIQIETRNNLFWNNQINVAGSSISLNTSTTENRDIINDYCPMLVHKSRVADNQKKYKYLHDGFYLAQRTGDASRFPLRLNDIKSVDISGLSQSPPSSSAGMWFFSNENWGCNWLGIYDGSGYYSDYSPTNWGSLLIRFYNDYPEEGDGTHWEIDYGSYLTITFGQNSSKLKAYLPHFYLEPGEVFWVYVAADGSTYYTRDDHNNGDPYQDAYFAMQYDIPAITGGVNNGLAESAYDGGYEAYGGNLAEVRSPAINKGAVRITPHSIAGTNSDVMCSNFASLGWTNSEDTVDNNRDCNTTLRWIAETTAANYTDPIGRLDLGYHYKGAVVYTSDVVSTFRYNGHTYYYKAEEDMALDHDIGSIGLRRVASGKFDTDTLNPTNIMVVLGTGPQNLNGYDYAGIAYHIQGTPILKGFDEISCESDHVIVMHSTDVKAAPDGKLFTGITGYTGDGSVYTEFIRVYRYNESQDSTSRIVNMSWNYDITDGITDNEAISSLAIAADTDNLWIGLGRFYRHATWAEDQGVWVTTFPRNSAATTLQLTDFSQLFSRAVAGAPIGMTFDKTYSYSKNTTTVRLMYLDPTDELGTRWHALRVELGYNGLNPADNKRISDIEPYWVGATKAEIVYNPNDLTGGYNQTYSLVHYGAQYNSEFSRYNLDAHTSNEHWNLSESYLRNEVGSCCSDLTYRANESKLIGWTPHPGNNGSGLHTSAGDIDPGLDNGLVLSLSTNAVNQRDLITSWFSRYDVNNDGNLGTVQDDEGVAICRELNP